jgi:hypothetical protein
VKTERRIKIKLIAIEIRRITSDDLATRARNRRKGSGIGWGNVERPLNQNKESLKNKKRMKLDGLFEYLARNSS